MIFNSRQHAGVLLGAQLQRRNTRAQAVFGLARGGVVVAAEVAKILHVPLTVQIVRKIGAPENPEFAVGAVAQVPQKGSSQLSSTVYWDEAIVSRIRCSAQWQKEQIEAKRREIGEYLHHLKGSNSNSDPVSQDHLQNVIIVDDGAATGVSMMAALNAAKTPLNGVAAKKIIVALPVASTDAASQLRSVADEVVILFEDSQLSAVGQYYRDFGQVSWAQVERLLQSSYGPYTQDGARGASRSHD